MSSLLRSCIASRICSRFGLQHHEVRVNKFRTLKTHSALRQEAKQPTSTSATGATGEAAAKSADASRPFDPSRHSYSPNNLEKKFLVWTGKYKTVDEVPNFINMDTMERARNRMRIKVSNILMVLTVVGCIVMVVSGRKAAERGESVSKMNLAWHKEYNEKNQTTEDKAPAEAAK